MIIPHVRDARASDSRQVEIYMSCRLLALLSDDLLVHVASFLPLHSLARLAFSSKGVAGHVRACLLTRRSWFLPLEAMKNVATRVHMALEDSTGAIRRGRYDNVMNEVRSPMGDIRDPFYPPKTFAVALESWSSLVKWRAFVDSILNYIASTVGRCIGACTAALSPADTIIFAKSFRSAWRQDELSGLLETEILRMSLVRAQWTPENAVDLSTSHWCSDLLLGLVQKTMAKLTHWAHSETLTPQVRALLINEYLCSRYWELVDGRPEDVKYDDVIYEARYFALWEGDPDGSQGALHMATIHLQCCKQIEAPILVVAALITMLVDFDNEHIDRCAHNSRDLGIDFEPFLATRSFVKEYFKDFDFTVLSAAERDAVLALASTSMKAANAYHQPYHQPRLQRDFFELSLRCIQEVSSSANTSLADVSRLCEVTLQSPDRSL